MSKDNIALVTGASGDIGGAIAKALGGHGCHVIGTYVGAADAATATVTAINDAGGSAEAMQLDQRDPEAIDALIETVRQKHNRLDILVNNAAWNIGIPFRRLDELTLRFGIALWKPIFAPRFCLPELPPRCWRRRWRTYRNFLSWRHQPRQQYCLLISKAGLNHLTRCLAVAMSPNVAVNCIAPGLVENTRMAQRLPDNVAEGARQTAVLGVGQAEDIANQVWPLFNQPLSPARPLLSTVVCPARCASFLAEDKG